MRIPLSRVPSTLERELSRHLINLGAAAFAIRISNTAGHRVGAGAIKRAVITPAGRTRS
jgi:hypothetical protein